MHNGVKDCYASLRKDVLETALAQRIEVATLLKKGESYIDINKLTGASTATISRVSKYYNYGSGGYNIVLERMNEDV